MPGDVVACTWTTARERPEAFAAELLTAARGVAAALGATLRWLHAGDTTASLAEIGARFGAGHVDRMEIGAAGEFQPDRYVAALAGYCSVRAPRLLVLPQTFDARVLAPRLATRIGAGVVMNGVAIGVSDAGEVEVTASAYGGDTRAVYALAGDAPSVVAITPGAVEAVPLAAPAPAEEHDIAVDLAGVEERIRIVEPARAEGPQLEDAGVIVAGGRGLGMAANFRLVEELAAAVGGLPAASRPIVDDGWVDSSRQIGLTGKTVRPALYIAVGVSGASQHMAGCAAARTIVAINRDRDAAIFRHARYGIVGDCLEIVPELIRAVKPA
jgi:electron transfer flavoprotein alpha subunit